jgi:hypothetical protein
MGQPPTRNINFGDHAAREVFVLCVGYGKSTRNGGNLFLQSFTILDDIVKVMGVRIRIREVQCIDLGVCVSFSKREEHL